METRGARSRGRTERLRPLAWLGLSAYLAASALVWSARWYWLGEIAASFAWHLGLAGLVASASAWLVASRRVALATAALALSHAGPELLLFLPGEPSPSSAAGRATAELRIANCNLLYDNREHAAFARFLREQDLDLVVCEEVTAAWRAALEDLRADYPHLALAPAPERWTPDTWGTAILSRRPFVSVRRHELPSPAQRPLLEVELELDGEPLVLRGVHPMRAGKAWRLALRDEALDALGRLPWPPRSVLVGDLNVTSTSPVFTRLLAASGLRDSRQGFGRQPSFVLRTRLCDLAIAIDHVLVGEALAVLERRIVDLPGSDHEAVVVRLARRADGEPAPLAR